MIHQGLVAVAVAVVAAVPRAALACAVCSPGQNDPAQSGFLIGTVILSMLPLLFIGSVVLWVFRRARRMAREEAAASILAPPQPLPADQSPPRAAAR